MNTEVITIVAMGLASMGLLVGLFAWLRADMVRMEERQRADMDKREEPLREDMERREERLREDMERREERQRADMDRRDERLREDIRQLVEKTGRLEHGQAKLEGLLEGLREAITRSVPS